MNGQVARVVVHHEALHTDARRLGSLGQMKPTTVSTMESTADRDLDLEPRGHERHIGARRQREDPLASADPAPSWTGVAVSKT